MSVKVMGRVWDLDLPPEEKFTLLALADHADHDGNNAHPGVELLAQKTGYSVRQIQYNLKKLRGRNLITPIESAAGGRGRQTTYQIFPERVQNVHPLADKNPAQPAPFSPQKGAQPAPFETEKGCNPRQKRVQSTTNPPQTPPNRSNRHEPSEEPKEGEARGRASAPALAPDLSEFVAVVEQITGVTRSAGVQASDAITRQAIALRELGFSPPEALRVAEASGKTYRLRFLAEDLVADRKKQTNGKTHSHQRSPETAAPEFRARKTI